MEAGKADLQTHEYVYSELESSVQCTPIIASFPGPTQLFVACSMEKQERATIGVSVLQATKKLGGARERG